MKIKTERMKNAGRKYVEKNFSWDKTSKKIEEIYKKF